MMQRLPGAAALLAVAGTVGAEAAVIDFEDVASPEGIISVGPSSPYTEDGVTLTPSSSDSAIFDAAATFDMPGNATDWFGFDEGNVLTLTAGGAPFDLGTLVAGPSTLATFPTINLTLEGTQAGGGTLSRTFFELSTATLLSLDWTGLTSLEISASDDAGIDDIAVTTAAVPLPTTLPLLAAALSGLGLALRRRA